MRSIILRTVARLLEPIMLVFAAFLLTSGHNHPGGGFSGGLMAAGAFILHVVAFDLRSALRLLLVRPHSLVGGGLLLCVASGLPGLLSGAAFLTGRWWSIHLPGVGETRMGTPLLFDLGVFLVVVGMVAVVVSALTEMQERTGWKPGPRHNGKENT